ncbi:MAG TPA: isocitrate dehydrogenase [Nitrococcus sp.]|nr:isocitrate dehydrogenase [Nitrococcus sp.]
MDKREIVLLPGDGIGPSITEATLEVLQHAGCEFQYHHALIGQTALDAGKELIPQETLDLIERTGIALKGPVTTPIGRGFTSVNVTLRKHFDLYANVRPVLSFKGAHALYADIDLIIIRENTEGMYSGQGQYLSADGSRAENLSVITRFESQRVITYAFALAQRLGRHKVTVCHKANILKATQGLFLEVGREVAKHYPDIAHQELIIDNTAMQLVMNPHQFDVIVTTNLFGDIISDLCAGLAGGLGLAPGANIGDSKAIFEAVHGSAPDIAGQNIANPAAMMLAACLMLDHLGMHEPAERIRTAIRSTIEAGDRTTRDLGGEGGTTDFAKAILERL